MENNEDWRDIRDSIKESVYDIWDRDDIAMQIKAFSDKAGVAIRDAGNYIKQSYENTVNNRPKSVSFPRAKKTMPKVFLNAKRTESVVRLVIGLPLIMTFGFAFLVATGVVLRVAGLGMWLATSIPLLLFIGAGMVLSLPASKNLKNLRKAWTYYNIMNGRAYINISDIARFSGETPSAVIGSLMDMIRQGIFPEGHLDDDKKSFMLNNDIYREYRELESQRRGQERLAAQTSESGRAFDDDGVKSVLDKGRSYIYSIKELHLGCDSEPMSSKLTTLETLLAAIFDRVEKAPKEVVHMDKLMKYYLPTTLKLIETYLDFDNVISPDEEVVNTKKEIELTVDSINQAFAEFQNRLFKSSAFDASADAALIKVMLTKEGLVGGMKAEESRL